MSVQTTPARAGVAERAAFTALVDEPEAPFSDAPVYTPQGTGVLLLLGLVSPRVPKESRPS
ncbi:hypothetical protein OG946_34925 [Streptomyces sp. NBC_01808]|uniref:hypothetical protein n=1 Tax=Streptomyces sp. NBC_01808 TaxID=2975947 RepID=UPI002DDB23F9|nr:hypothetical protein [Streptomyces sp. NBC_01808]WSA42109.1 hypothetical protein OG946_34925 [Streptomyces sp. NBC_01808]